VVTALMRSVAGERPFEEILHRECATLATEMKTSKGASSVLNVASDIDA
jgi:hypothetical protein